MTSVRARKAISTTAIAVLLLTPACTTPDSASPKTRPIPKGDEVVVLAGSGAADVPKAGVFSTETPLRRPNAMAFSPNDGALLVASNTDSEEVIVRIGIDGYTSVIESAGYGPMKAMAVRGGDVWTFWPNPADVGNPSSLERQPLSGGDATEFFGRVMNGKNLLLTEVDDHGKPLRAAAQKALIESWDGEGMALSKSGTPIIAMPNGKLYQALGHHKVRAYTPSGYSSALNTVGGKDFATMATLTDNSGNLIIAGSMGAIRIPENGKATAIRFHPQIPPMKVYGWGAAVLDNGDFLFTSQAKMYRVKSDGSVVKITTGKNVTCQPAKKLSEFGLTSRTYLQRLADGTVAISFTDKCNRVYIFRPSGS
jgi:hypothetical protein